MCPGCDASHHAACHDEHGACASCALIEPREGVSAATKGDAPADDRGALAPRRRELERLGFSIISESPDELVALHPDLQLAPFVARMPHTVIVRRLAHLTLADLSADLAALRTHPRRSRVTIPVYLVDRADPDARRFVTEGAAVTQLPLGGRLFPVIHERETGAGTFYAGTRPLGALTFPQLHFLARRLLRPWLVVPARPEWPVVTVLMMIALIILTLLVVNGVLR
jgi:hypothetical protein